jgi:lipid-binding SYLF domain-containing protein
MKHASLLTSVILALGALSSLPSSSRAASAAEIDRDAKAALNALYTSNPTAQLVGKKAKAILVFPRIIKGGFMVGGQHGDGALLVMARLSPTTTRSPPPTASKRVFRNSAMPCSL